METKTIKTVNASDIPIQDLTTGVLEGKGVFDKFLTLHRAVLDREFNLGRIVGKEYSDTFIKTYGANLELSIKFLLEKEKQAYEIEILEGQVCNLTKDCETKQFNLDFMLPKELEIKDAQMRKMEADVLIAMKQLEIADKELLLKEKQLLQQDKQLELLEEQLKLQKQKLITEIAQTDPSVVLPGSVIDTNIKALEAQIEGMDRDAKQKIMNMMVGTFNTRINNDLAEPKPDNYLTDKAIAQVIKDTLESSNMSVLPTIDL